MPVPLRTLPRADQDVEQLPSLPLRLEIPAGRGKRASA
jgi:hypothetical protein